MRAALAGWLGAIVRPHEPQHGKVTPGEVQGRFRIDIHPQEAPDPSLMGGAYGLIPSRPAMVTIQRYFHDTQGNMEGRFVAGVTRPAPAAALPRGRQTPFGQRSNIHVPSHVAYGSLFTSSQSPYGLS